MARTVTYRWFRLAEAPYDDGTPTGRYFEIQERLWPTPDGEMWDGELTGASRGPFNADGTPGDGFEIRDA